MPQPKHSAKGLSIDTIDLVVNFVEPNNYFGGQIRLTAEDDGISFQTTTEALQDLAIVKANKLIADAQVVVPEPEPEYTPIPVLTSPNGTNFKLIVDDDGNLSTEKGATNAT